MTQVDHDSLPAWLHLTLEAGPTDDDDRFYLEGIPSYSNVDQQYDVAVTSSAYDAIDAEDVATAGTGSKRQVFSIQVSIYPSHIKYHIYNA